MTQGKMLSRRQSGEPSLCYSLHPAQGQAQARVLLTHGYCEHSGRYQHVVQSWTARGICVVTYDLRGHGRSEGLRGHIQHFDEYLDDALELLDALQEEPQWDSALPLFLFGHSLGGLISFHLALRDQSRFQGLLMTSPYMGLALRVSPVKRALGRAFSYVWPTFALSTGLKGADLTHDAAIAAAYDSDPMLVQKATSRWFTETQDAQTKALEWAPKLTIPVMCWQAGADRVASVEASRKVIEAAGSKDRSWTELPGLFHEILNEPERDRWLEQLALQLHSQARQGLPHTDCYPASPADTTHQSP